MTIQSAALLGVTDLLYAAALSDDAADGSESAWRAALDSMRHVCGASGSAVLGLTCGRMNFARQVLVGIRATDAEQYVTYYAARDPVIEPALASAGRGVLLFSDELMPRAQLVRSEFYTDWLRTRGWLSGAASTLIDRGTSRCVLYLARELRCGSFTPDEVQALQLIVPHAQRAAALAIRLLEHRTTSHTTSIATSAAGAALIIVDRHAAPVFVNRAAEALLHSTDRISVDASRAGCAGALRGATGAITQRLRALVAAACGTDAEATQRKSLARAPHEGSGGTLVMRTGAGRAPLVICVSPMPVAAQGARSLFHHLLPAASESRALLTCVDLAHGPNSTATDGNLRACLCSSFGLTLTEAAVAVDIAAGLGLAAVAAQRHVTLATIRSQAAHIYLKTGVRGQVELASFVTRLAAQLSRQMSVQ
jgi:DNA-binding CsgD family transcriptional regulator/PAS domain-containing protein